MGVGIIAVIKLNQVYECISKSIFKIHFGCMLNVVIFDELASKNSN